MFVFLFVFICSLDIYPLSVIPVCVCFLLACFPIPWLFPNKLWTSISESWRPWHQDCHCINLDDLFYQEWGKKHLKRLLLQGARGFGLCKGCTVFQPDQSTYHVYKEALDVLKYLWNLMVNCMERILSMWWREGSIFSSREKNAVNIGQFWCGRKHFL